jgi:hypothetical protein
VKLWPGRVKSRPLVRTYASDEEFKFDQHLMRVDGWHVASSWKSNDGSSRVVWVRSKHHRS